MRSVAPNHTNRASLHRYAPMVRQTAMPSRSTKQLARMAEAPSLFCSPDLMESSGAPPFPIQAANAEIIVTIGPQIPTPASAMSPTSAIFPIYMRSIML